MPSTALGVKDARGGPKNRTATPALELVGRAVCPHTATKDGCCAGGGPLGASGEATSAVQGGKSCAISRHEPPKPRPSVLASLVQPGSRCRPPSAPAFPPRGPPWCDPRPGSGLLVQPQCPCAAPGRVVEPDSGCWGPSLTAPATRSSPPTVACCHPPALPAAAGPAVQRGCAGCKPAAVAAWRHPSSSPGW